MVGFLSIVGLVVTPAAGKQPAPRARLRAEHLRARDARPEAAPEIFDVMNEGDRAGVARRIRCVPIGLG